MKHLKGILHKSTDDGSGTLGMTASVIRLLDNNSGTFGSIGIIRPLCLKKTLPGYTFPRSTSEIRRSDCGGTIPHGNTVCCFGF